MRIAEVAIGPRDDASERGRRAALVAIEALHGTLDGVELAYEGTRPIVRGPAITVSITHGATRAVAVATRAEAVGIDLVDDSHQMRLAELAPRFLAAEAALTTSPESTAACFAAKEAALKALGLGLLDGGMFDDCAVRVVSLEPPRLEPASLALRIERLDGGTLAIAWRHAERIGAPPPTV